MSNKKRNAGFTLIELLVVIAIIALLLSILIPGLKRAKEITKQIVCASQLRQCGIAVKMYSDDNEEYLPDAHYLDNDKIDMNSPNHHSYTVYRDTGDPGEKYSNGRLKPFRFAYLYEGDYIDTPEIFYCPGNNKKLVPQFVYESYTSPEPWGFLPQDYNAGGNQWVRIGYTYYPTDARPKLLAADGTPLDKSLKFTRMNPSIPYTSDVIHGLDVLSHKRNVQIDENDVVVDGIFGLNALYIDGHVSFCNDRSVFWDTVNPANGNDPWELIENIAELRDYDEVFFTVFRAIGP